MNLFRERGFHNTTVEDITNAADVGKGTFFNYFPSKEHILGVLGEVQGAKYDKAATLARAQQTRDALHWLYHALPSESGSSPKMVAKPVYGFPDERSCTRLPDAGLGHRARETAGDVSRRAEPR